MSKIKRVGLIAVLLPLAAIGALAYVIMDALKFGWDWADNAIEELGND